jgi:hypothetical protein
VEAFQTNPVSLRHLLSEIQERELALPDFQRDFVWDPRATEELIESISRSFPAGSLLFMPWRENTFAPRAIQGVKKYSTIEQQAELLVLPLGVLSEARASMPGWNKSPATSR